MTPPSEPATPSATWERFVRADKTLGPTPGVREQWHKGRARYSAWVLRVNDPRVGERVRRVQRQLADVLVPVPVDDLHITVYVAGFPASEPIHDDDVSEAILNAQVKALTQLRQSAPRLWIGGVSSFAVGPFLEVAECDIDGIPADETPLNRLRSSLSAVHPELRWSPYLPHLSIGSYAATVSVKPIIEALAALRHEPYLQVVPKAVELVEWSAAEPTAPLITRWSLPLGS